MKKTVFGLLFLVINVQCTRNTIRDYNEDGILVYEAEIDAQDRLDGISKEYDQDGNLIYENRYSKGKLHGRTLIYFPEGGKKVEVNYQNDKLIEIILYQDDFGNDLDYGDFTNGNGSIKLYNSFGDLRWQGMMKNGLKDGMWYKYNNLGLSDSIKYIEGIATGEDNPDIIYF